MTDIQNSSFEQIEAINKRKNMTTEIKDTKKVKKNGTRQRIATPAYTSVEDATEEEIQEALNATRFRSEFSETLNGLSVGEGKKFAGDILRLKQKVSVFAKSHGRKFVVRAGNNGYVIIVRSEDPVPSEVFAEQNA